MLIQLAAHYSSAEWTPAALFEAAERGIWYEMGAQHLSQDLAGTTPVTTDGEPVYRGEDLSPNTIPFLAPSSAARPMWKDTNVLRFDKSDDKITVDFVDPFDGTVWIKTPNGILNYEISVSGVWNLPLVPNRLHDNDLGPIIAVEGSVTAPKVEGYMGGDNKFAGVTSMAFWFRERADIKTIYAGNWDTSSVTSFSNFAWASTSLTTLDVSNWDTSSATTFISFIYGCTSLTALDVSNWDTSSATSFSFFAYSCTSLTTLDVSNWNTSSVTSFFSFIFNCTSLTTLDVSNWNTSSVTSFSGFANFSTSLTTVTVTGGAGNPFADSPCTNYSNAFGDTNLTQQSIDDILVAINQANTSSGTFGQSGGSAPSATGNAAIDALRGRGWTITVTGGY